MREADPRADRRGAQAGPPPRHHRAGRRDPGRAAQRAAGSTAGLTAAYAATVRSLIAVIATLNEQVKRLQGQVEAHFGQHPDAEIYLSQPGLGRDPRRPGAGYLFGVDGGSRSSPDRGLVDAAGVYRRHSKRSSCQSLIPPRMPAALSTSLPVAEVDLQLLGVAAADVEPVEMQRGRTSRRASRTRLLHRRFPMRRRVWLPSWSWNVPRRGTA